MPARWWHALWFAAALLDTSRAAAQTASGAAPGSDEVWCRAEGIGVERCVRSWAQCEAPTRVHSNDCHRLDGSMYCFAIVARGHDAAPNELLECHASMDACVEGRKATAARATGAQMPSACEAVRPHGG